MGTASANVASSVTVDENNNIVYAAAGAIGGDLGTSTVTTEETADGAEADVVLDDVSGTQVVATVGVTGGDNTASTLVAAQDGTVSTEMDAEDWGGEVAAATQTTTQASGDVVVAQSEAEDQFGCSAGTGIEVVNGAVATFQGAEAGSTYTDQNDEDHTVGAEVEWGANKDKGQVTVFGADSQQISSALGDEVSAHTWALNPDGASSYTSIGAEGDATLITKQQSGADFFKTVAVQVKSTTTGDSAWAYTAASQPDNFLWWSYDRESTVATQTGPIFMDTSAGNMKTTQIATTGGPNGHTQAAAFTTAGEQTEINVEASYTDPANWFNPSDSESMGTGAGDSIFAGATTKTSYIWWFPYADDHVWADVV